MEDTRGTHVSRKAPIALHDRCPAAHLLVGGDGRIRHINQTLALILGYEPDEVTGRHVLEFVQPRDTGRVLEELHRGPVGRYEPALEVAVRAKDGTARTLLFARSLPHPRTPGPKGAMVLLTGIDITDTRTSQQMSHERDVRQLQARHLESAGRVATGVARHFDGLLNTIALAAGQLAAAPGIGESGESAVERIRKATARAARLTTRLRDFAQDRPAHLEPVDVSELIASAVESLRDRLASEIEVAVNVPSDLPTPSANPARLHEAIVQLGLNANEAMPDGGRITITAERAKMDEPGQGGPGHNLPAGHYLRITVSDTGTGMDKDTLALAFEPFFTTKDPARWAGLGLSTVHACVATHRGAVRLKSDPGRGTQATILMPLSPTP